MEPMSGVTPRQGGATRWAWVEGDLRRVAAVVSAGLVMGFVVLGVLNRLGMLLLARLNPAAHGRVSDDGFVIGRFDLASTAELVLLGTAIGVFGGVLFLAVEHLRFGPRWFRVASMSVGPAVVVGAMIVHTGGVDFEILGPVWATVGVFVLLPGLYALGLTLLADRWLAEGSWARRPGRRWMVGLLPGVLALPAAFLWLPLTIGRAIQQTVPLFDRWVTDRRFTIALRAAFIAVFVLGAVDLITDVIALARG